MKHLITISFLTLCAGSLRAQPQKIKYNIQSDAVFRYAQHIVETKNGLTPAKTSAIKQRVTGQAGFAYLGGAAFQLDSLKCKYSGDRGSRFDYNAFTYDPYFSIYPEGDGSGFGDLEVKADSAWTWEGASLDLNETIANSFSADRKAMDYKYMYIPDSSYNTRNAPAYDANGRLTEIWVFDWNTNTAAWDTSAKYTYAYNSQNQIVADSKYYYSLGALSLFETGSCQYNSGGFLVSNIIKKDFGQGMTDFRGYNFTYYPDNTIKERMSLYNYGSGLQPNYRDSLGYGSSKLYYTYGRSWKYDHISMEWEPMHLTVRSLNSGGIPDTTHYYYWDTQFGEFEHYMAVALTYNSFNNPVTTDFYDPSGGVMELVYFVRFTYENYNDLSIRNEKARDEIIVYPNPAGESLQVQWKRADNSPMVVGLTNTAGQKVRSYTHTGAMDSERISLSGLTPGLYFLTVSNDKGEMVHRQTIMKQ